MKCLIIGLGIYGSNLAKDLTNVGHEVIGADMNPALVEAVKDYVATVYVADSTDEAALNALPIFGVDMVIVAIGENFGASVKTVAMLKHLGVKKVFARAVDEIHQAILEGLGVNRILTPEQRAAFDLTQEMLLGSDTRVLKVTGDEYVMTFPAPDRIIGMKYSGLNLGEDYGLSLVVATRKAERRNIFGVLAQTQVKLDWKSDASLRVEEGDEITCFGSLSGYKKIKG